MNATLHTNGTAAAVQNQRWLQASVREFFTAFNWEDHPPEVQEVKQQSIQSGETTLSLALTVRQFFNAIPWDGAIAEPLTLEAILDEVETNPADNFTLDDFSDFF